MRQGQSKRLRGRSRGGGGGGGKGPNPLSRSYESNGPDVKIRGTAGTIADKYVQLSRDATSSGDPVAAENYMQHAEHYYRLLAAAQAQYQPHQTFVRADADDFADLDFDEESAEGGEANGQQHSQSNGQQQPFGNQQQPRHQNNGRQNGYGQGGQQGGQQGGGRDGDQRRFDRNDRRDDRRDNRNDRNDGRYDRGERSDEQPAVGELPAFITSGAPQPAAEEPHRPAAEATDDRADTAAVEQVAADATAADAAAEGSSDEDPRDDGARRPSRGRRRRYGRYGRGSGAGEDDGGADPAPQTASDSPSD